MSEPSEQTLRAIGAALDSIEADPSLPRSITAVATIAGVARSTVNRVFAWDRRAVDGGIGLAKRWAELKRHSAPRPRGNQDAEIAALKERIAKLEKERDALLSLLYEREVAAEFAEPGRIRLLPASGSRKGLGMDDDAG